MHFFISLVATWLGTRRFSQPTFGPPRPTNHWKNIVFRDFLNISRPCLFFLLSLSLFNFSSLPIVSCLTSKLPLTISYIHLRPQPATPPMVWSGNFEFFSSLEGRDHQDHWERGWGEQLYLYIVYTMGTIRTTDTMRTTNTIQSISPMCAIDTIHTIRTTHSVYTLYMKYLRQMRYIHYSYRHFYAILYLYFSTIYRRYIPSIH